MSRLRGMGLGTGIAIGTAVVLRSQAGKASFPEIPARLTRQARHETPDIILVTEDYRNALAWVGGLPWGRVVGIAAASAAPYSPIPPVPTVVNVLGLLDAIQEGVLMLVDAERGVVLADPDGMTLAQYQAQYEQFAPRPRIHLGAEHLTAQTIDGRTIQVLGAVSTAENVSSAVQGGADAVFVPFDAPLLPADADEATLRRNLFALLREAEGKSLILSDSYTLPLVTILEAATRSDILLALPPREDLEGLGLKEQTEEFEIAIAECLENNVLCTAPRLAANIVSADGYCEPGAEEEWVGALAACGATRILVSMEQSGALDEQILPGLEALVGAAASHLIPVFVSAHNRCFNLFGLNNLKNTLETAIHFLVGIGVRGILVKPHEIVKAKATISESSYAECRDAFDRFRAESEGTREVRREQNDGS